MIGKPKYKLEDKVLFKLGNETYVGMIYIVDKYGVFEDNSDVHYDIYVLDDKFKNESDKYGVVLFKHIKEPFITKKLRSNSKEWVAVKNNWEKWEEYERGMHSENQAD